MRREELEPALLSPTELTRVREIGSMLFRTVAGAAALLVPRPAFILWNGAGPRVETPTTRTASRSNPSGSGTSSSGGKDDNGDAGRDKMPESDRTVWPQSQQRHPNDK